MGAGNSYGFAVYGILGVERIEVFAKSVAEAIKIAESWTLDGQRPIKVDLIDHKNENFRLLGKE